jgi:YVTN family beta-propeller protein
VAEFTADQVAVFDIATQSVREVFTIPGGPSGLVLSADGSRLYVTSGVAEGKVHVVDTQKGAIVESLPVGHTPNAPVLSPDGETLYVCNRYSNDVSVIDLAGSAEKARIKVTREPVAAVISADGRRLFVANQLPAGPANLGDIAAVVSVIDTRERRVVTDIRLPDGSASLRGLDFSPDGQFVYATHLSGRYKVPTSQIERGWIYTNALSIIEAGSFKLLNTVLLDDITQGAANPWGISSTPDGRYLCVAHAGTHEVSVIDRRKLHEKLEAIAQGEKVSEGSTTAAQVLDDLSFVSGIRTRVPLEGNGPRDLIVVGKTVYTTEYFTGSLGVLELPANPYTEAKSVSLGEEPPMTQVRLGERNFYDGQYSYQTWLSCTSCHPSEGRPDGLNWDLMLDGVGNPKNTKSLLLAHQTPPTTSSGTRANAEVSVRSGIKHILFAELPEPHAASIDAYLKSLKPVPGPYLENGKLSPSALRGKEVFLSADCASCHPAPLYTTLRPYDVGTGAGMEKGLGYDTPTLIENWRTAPYFHDGRAATLKDVFTAPNAGKAHTMTPQLNEQQIDDLVHFVLSL